MGNTKLGFMNVPNGDVIAFDMKESEINPSVVYLSHDDGDCPMIYCKSFGFMFLLASLVQNVWRSVCGVICGKGLSL